MEKWQKNQIENTIVSHSETKVGAWVVMGMAGWVCEHLDANVKAHALRRSKVLNVTEKLWRMVT